MYSRTAPKANCPRRIIINKYRGITLVMVVELDFEEDLDIVLLASCNEQINVRVRVPTGKFLCNW